MIETIQIKDQGFTNYIAEVWNLNDLSMQLIFSTYCYLRLFSPEYKGDFITVKKFEYEDGH